MMMKRALVSFILLGSMAIAATRQGPNALDSSFAQLPFVYELNAGQSSSKATLLGYGGGYHVEVSADSILLTTRQGSQIHLRLPGARPDVKPEGVKSLGGVSNYYRGKNPNGWITSVPMYSRVMYSKVYPGIDIEYHSRGRNLEYDFVLHPGASPRLVSLDIEGSSPLRLTKGGDLRVGAGPAKFVLHRPEGYQWIDGQKRSVTVEFSLNGRRVGFRVGKYDRRLPLVIDPVITFGTFVSISPNASEELQAAAVDSTGSLHLVSSSSGVQIVKLSPSGNSVSYVTHLGSGFDEGYGITVDSSGNSYVVGVARESAFPVTAGSYIASCSFFGSSTQCQTPFATKLSPSGSLLYSTFLGGSNGLARAVAVDTSGNAYIAGTIASTDFPAINAFQPQYGGQVSTSSTNAFLVKLSPNGTSALYSTFFGIDGGVSGTGVAVDGSGSAYLGGSASFGAVPLRKPLSRRGTAFIAKFTTDGSQLQYGTLIGGNGKDTLSAIAVDSQGTLFATGTTTSTDFPVTANAIKATARCPQVGPSMCDQDAFLLRLNAAGDGLVFSTYLGGSGTETAQGLSLDVSGNVFVSGTTGSADFPTVKPVQSALQQFESYYGDAFISQFSPDGSLLFSSYLGGAFPYSETLALVGTDSAGNAYIAGGTTTSNVTPTDFPLVAPLQEALSCCTLYETFAAKIDMSSSASAISVAPRETPVVYLRNVGGTPVSISNVRLNGGPVGTTCTGTLAAGSSCRTGVGQAGGSFSYSTSAGSGSFFIAAGRDMSGAWILDISPRALVYPAQLVGTPSEVKQMKITNLRGTSLTLPQLSLGSSAIKIASDDCGGRTLASGASCNIGIYIVPTSGFFGNTGGQMGLSIGNATWSIYAFAAFAVNNALDASPSFIDFGDHFLGAGGKESFLSIFNDSALPLAPTELSISGDFSLGNSCAEPIPPHADCRLRLVFAPQSTGTRKGTITFNFAGPGSSRTVELKGIGRQITDLELNPVDVDFYATYIGSTSTTYNDGITFIAGSPPPVKVTNASPNSLTISSLQTTGDFAQTNDCPGVLAPAQVCTVQIYFSPTVLGPRTGTLFVNHSGQGNPAYISLTGTGRSRLDITPETREFAAQVVGRSGPWQWISVGNSQAQPITLQNITVTGDFALMQNPCPAVMNAYQGCALQVEFKPSAAGLRTGVLTITTDLNEGGPRVVALRGTGLDFGLSLNRPVRTSRNAVGANAVRAGETVTAELTLTTSPGFNLPVTLNCRAPKGIVCEAPARYSADSDKGELRISLRTIRRKATRLQRTGEGTQPGNYMIEVTASAAGLIRRVNIPLSVF